MQYTVLFLSAFTFAFTLTSCSDESKSLPEQNLVNKLESWIEADSAPPRVIGLKTFQILNAVAGNRDESLAIDQDVIIQALSKTLLEKGFDISLYKEGEKPDTKMLALSVDYFAINGELISFTTSLRLIENAYIISDGKLVEERVQTWDARQHGVTQAGDPSDMLMRSVHAVAENLVSNAAKNDTK